MEKENINDRLEIRQALERQLGYGAGQKVADVFKVKSPIVFGAISGRTRSRRDISILAYIAGVIGQPVRGVRPDGTEIENILA